MPERLHQRLLRVLAHNMHFVTFLPLIIMSVLQDVHLFLAALISTCLVVTFLLVGFILHRNHYIKVRSYQAPGHVYSENVCMLCFDCFGKSWSANPIRSNACVQGCHRHPQDQSKTCMSSR